jgi:hypothetical protein
MPSGNPVGHAPAAETTCIARAKTFDDLDQALTLAGNADALMRLEIVLPKQDVPELLARITRGVAKVNGSVA